MAEAWEDWRAQIGVEDRKSVQSAIRTAYMDSCPSYEELLQVVVAIDEEFTHAVSINAMDYFAQATRFSTKVRNKKFEIVDRSRATFPMMPIRPPALPSKPPVGKQKKLDEPLEIGEIFDLDAAFKGKDKKEPEKLKVDEDEEFDLAAGLSRSTKSVEDEDVDYYEIFEKSQIFEKSTEKSQEDQDLDLATALSASMRAEGTKPRARTDFASRRSVASRKEPEVVKQSAQRNAFSRWQQQQPAPVVAPQKYTSQQKQRHAFSHWQTQSQDREVQNEDPNLWAGMTGAGAYHDAAYAGAGGGAGAGAGAGVSTSFAQARANSRLNRSNNRSSLHSAFSL